MAKKTTKVTTEECICGSTRLPVFFADGTIAGHMCKECGSTSNADTSKVPTLWDLLSDDALDNAVNLIYTHPGKKFDMQIREIPTFAKR